jgi:hypothetical protein
VSLTSDKASDSFFPVSPPNSEHFALGDPMAPAGTATSPVSASFTTSTELEVASHVSVTDMPATKHSSSYPPEVPFSLEPLTKKAPFSAKKSNPCPGNPNGQTLIGLASVPAAQPFTATQSGPVALVPTNGKAPPNSVTSSPFKCKTLVTKPNPLAETVPSSIAVHKIADAAAVSFGQSFAFLCRCFFNARSDRGSAD